MKKLFTSLFTSAAIISSAVAVGQTTTPGTLTFTFTQVAHSPCYTGSRNVLAVWIQTSSGAFVKTKLRNAGGSTSDHLPTWAVNSGGTAANCMSSACNKTDATTGATLSSFGTKTIVWDGKNVSGTVNGVTVPDGTYKVTIQETWNHGTGSTVTSSFTFTKGPVADHQTPANTSSFSNMTLDWVPASTTGVEEAAAASPELNIYPNPTEGLFNVDFSNASSIKVFNVLGAEVYNEKFEQVQTNGTKTIDLSTFSNGIYFVYVSDENNRSTKKKLILNK